MLPDPVQLYLRKPPETVIVGEPVVDVAAAKESGYFNDTKPEPPAKPTVPGEAPLPPPPPPVLAVPAVLAAPPPEDAVPVVSGQPPTPPPPRPTEEPVIELDTPEPPFPLTPSVGPA